MNKFFNILFPVAAVLLGFSIGLVVAWELAPTRFIDTSPSSLRIDFKDEYRYMIASAYNATGDLPRAQARLATLGDTNPVKVLGEQAQRMMASNSSMKLIQILADLSQSLQSNPAAVASQPANPVPSSVDEQPPEPSASPSTTNAPRATEAAAEFTSLPESETQTEEPASASPVPTSLATLPAPPKQTATFTPVPAFELAKQSSLCEPSQPALLQIYLSDAKIKPVAGIELIITWFGGEEHFFSGLKPEISPGYADYTLNENVEYDLSIAATGTRVTGLRTTGCTDASGNVYPGSIRLEFKQP